MKSPSVLLLLSVLAAAALARGADQPDNTAAILTPAPAATPRINGPSVFGVRPGSPLLYTIPATGERPMQFAVDNLPAGLALEAASGRLTGTLAKAGTYAVTLHATNARGATQKKFRIVVGDSIALTPAMGWNSWNCWADAVDQQKVLRSARALVSSGLVNHGWTYVNIDDTWQGQRTGKDGALQSNAKFPDMKALCTELHTMGLKAGIYSTPWVTSYASYAGGSADQADGSWSKEALGGEKGHHHGKYSFTSADANQWAAWGFDYLKYDWYPNDVPHTAEMSAALRASGRDIVFSLSNAAPIEHAADWARLANSWRTTGDIWDRWGTDGEFWHFGVSEIGFSQERWAPTAGPGHWNDPDMLVVGQVGWGHPHPSRLTPDEQYTHMSLWALLSSPLLIGCDMSQLDDFTKSLLSNDEVLDVNQDPLGKPAGRISMNGTVQVWARSLEDGSKAVGLFNLGDQPASVSVSWQELGIKGPQIVRDLWRQKDLGSFAEKFEATVPSHGVVLVKIRPAGTAASK